MYGQIGYPGGIMPSMNPSPFQYPAPSMFGQQSMMQNQPAQQQAQQAGPVVIYVPNVSQVKDVDMRGIGKALVIVQNEPVIAMRTSDNMGLTSTEYYTLTKYDPETVASAHIQTNEYVTRAEFEEFVSKMNSAQQKTSKSQKTDTKE